MIISDKKLMNYYKKFIENIKNIFEINININLDKQDNYIWLPCFKKK